MISNSHESKARIIHISRPLRLILRRILLSVLLVAAIMGVLISRDESQFSNKLREKVVDTSLPIINFVSRPVKFVGELDDSVKGYFFAREKNAKLMEENKALRKQLISISTVAYENEGLRKLLNYVKDSPYKFVSAQVVGDTSSPFLRSILINAGKKDNIKKGQAVVNADGLVGRIIEVGERSSRVLLLTDINSNIPVISNKSRERSIMSGNNNESPDLVYLPNDTKMTKGEVLVTSGDGEMFPPGLQVGVAYSAGGGAFKVSPFVKWHRLDHLSIIEYPR